MTELLLILVDIFLKEMSRKQLNLVVLFVFILNKFVVTTKRHGDSMSKFIVIYNDRIRWQQM